MSTYTGETLINNGTVKLDLGSNRLPTGTVVSLGQAASANLGTFDLNGQSQQIAGLVSTTGINAAATKNTVTSATAATLTISVANGVTHTYGDGTAANSGVLSGALLLVKTGSGTQVLGDANTFTGGTTISAGTLQVGAGGATGSLAGAITNNAALVFNRSGAITADNLISGTGSVTKQGAGTLTLSGANTYTGTSTISAGTLLVGHLTALGTGAVTVNGGTLDLNTANLGGQIANVITVTSGSVINGITASAADTAGTVAVTTVLTGAADLTKTTAGTLTLSTPHFHTGATVANTAGVVIQASHLADTGSSLGAGSLSDPTKLQLGAGAVLEFTGATTTNSSRSFTLTNSAGITTAAGAAGLTFTSAAKIALSGATPALALVANNSVTNIFRASLSDADIAAGNGLKTLTIDGAGVWVIGGNSNRFKQDIRVDAGAGSTIGLESGALPSGATLGVADGAKVRWETGNTTPVKLEIAAGTTAKLDLGSNNIVFNTAPTKTGSGTSANFEKQGLGTLTIAANVNAAAFNFSLPANSGLLSVGTGGSLGNVSLATGSKLGGSGTVGAVTASAGSTISPGNSPGILFAESMTLAAPFTFLWEVQDALAGPGVGGYDKLVLSTSLDLTGAAANNKITIKINSLTADGVTIGNATNFGPPNGNSSLRTFQFASVQTGANGVLLGNGLNISDVFQFDVTDFRYTGGGLSNASLWSIDWNSGTGAITLTAVPEPSTYGLGLGALTLAAAAIRRRKQKAKA